MSLTWTKKLISSLTVLSLTAALVVGVFSQSHAALVGDPQTDVSDPCAEHITTSAGSLEPDSCETLCYSADLNHLIETAVDRTPTLDLVAVPVSYEPIAVASLSRAVAFQSAYDRGPPGNDLYLTTQRLRL